MSQPAGAAGAVSGGARTSAGAGAVAGSTEGPSIDGGSGGAANAEGGAGGAPVDTGDYRRFLQERNDGWYARWSECFGTPRALLPFGHIDFAFPVAEESLRLGLSTMDAAAARRCLEAVATASCERIAEIGARWAFDPGNTALPECRGVLVGQVLPGETCRREEDCQLQDQYACVGDGVCGRVCTPRPLRAAGATCSAQTDRCPDGTVCRFGVDDGLVQHCLPPTPEGGACSESFECASGLHCARRGATAVLDGTCRVVGVGTRCAGNWECPSAYVCAGAGPNETGTCQLGKSAGEACTTYLADVNSNAYSDCAPATHCLDVDGKGARCVDGAPLGASCGTQTGPYPGWIDCLDGYCATDPMSNPVLGICQPLRAADAACEFDTQCAQPNRCVKGADGQRCGLLDVPIPLGARCNFFEGATCGPDAYCAFPPEYDPISPYVPENGSCAPLKRIGEPCREPIDICEPLAECVQGVCQGC